MKTFNIKEVSFKAKYGRLWIRAEVVKRVKGGYILNCGSTQGFFVRDEDVKRIAA